MKKAILRDIFVKKEIKKISKIYTKYDIEHFASFRIPEITVHGRFQPPLHVNHFYTYIATGFRIAEKVRILITNPNLTESNVSEAPHRNAKDSNPLTYDERVKIFKQFFKNIGIPKSRYDIKPFDITNKKTWKNTLNKDVPNLINTYGDWSKAKLSKFQDSGYKVIHSSFPKIINVSGTQIRKLLFGNMELEKKKKALLKAGLMPEALNAVLDVFMKK